MKFSRSRLVTATLIAFSAMTASACSTPLEVSEPVQPTADASLGRLLGGVIGTTTGLVGATTNTLTSLVFGLLKCVPLPNEEASKVIGRNGGTIRTSEYTLEIPAGALSKDVRITMAQVKDTVNSVRFGPSGLQFAKPAQLTMSYDNCWSNPRAKTNRIVYVDERLQVLEVPDSRDDQKNEKVVGEIDHFSRYAIAW